MCFLTDPSPIYRDSFLEGAAEFEAENRLDSTYAVCLGYSLRSLARRHDSFVRDLRALADPNGGSGSLYVDKVLWLVDRGEYIGQVSIRPDLCTSYLITYGGHIGYSIRPTRRRQGYGRKLLQLTLDASRALGLDRILVTCDSDNLGSRKIIEANGGRFERALQMDDRAFRAEGRARHPEVEKPRYWIDLVDDPTPAAAVSASA